MSKNANVTDIILQLNLEKYACQNIVTMEYQGCLKNELSSQISLAQ